MMIMTKRNPCTRMDQSGHSDFHDEGVAHPSQDVQAHQSGHLDEDDTDDGHCDVDMITLQLYLICCYYHFSVLSTTSSYCLSPTLMVTSTPTPQTGCV